TGGALGFLASLILVAAQVAGQFLDFQMGFFTASEVDPVMGVRVPLVGNYLYLLSMVLFLSFDGHHHLLRVLRESFTEIPPGSPLSSALLPGAFSFMSWMFRAAFQISLPVLACLFVTSVALGILARTMPQLNLFVLGIPIRILVGMTMLMVTTTVYASFFRDESGERILDLFRLLGAW
ncbi:MAG: flagellar biosynthetic protein FliR, partial [Bacillota bacterium]